MIRIKLKDTPPSTQNIYRHKGNRTYMTAVGKLAKETYQWEIKKQYKGKPVKGNISVIIELFFKDKKKRDVDNFNKLILDAATGLLWEDDSQITELVIRKLTAKGLSGVNLTVW